MSTQVSSSKIVARFLAAQQSKISLIPSLKPNPLQGKVEKAVLVIVKLIEMAERAGSQAASHKHSYKGDPSKVMPALDRFAEPIRKLIPFVRTLKAEVAVFLHDKAAEANAGDDYEKRIFDDAEKWWDEFWYAFGEARAAFDKYEEARKANEDDEAYNQAYMVYSTLEPAKGSLHNFASSLISLTRAKLEAPAQTAEGAPAKEQILAHMNSQVMGVAKEAAKKLSNDPAACAVLGGEVLEDSNAHTALKAAMPHIQHYYKAITPEQMTVVRPLVSKVSGSFEWDIVRCAAFMVGIMKIAKCREEGAVLAAIAGVYDEQGVFKDEP